MPPAPGAQLMPFNDARHLEATPPKIMVRGEGCHVYDEAGKRYLECVGGLWCAGLGFSNRAVIEAITAQLDALPFYHGFLGKGVRPSVELADRLVELAPDALTRVFFANSGSEAVDTAVKIVRYYNNARGQPRRKKIIAREQAYHGSGVISAALTSMDYCHERFDVTGPLVLRTGSPHWYQWREPGEAEAAFSRRRARELDALIRAEGPDTVAAMIGEPVIGSGGCILPPDGYWEAIQEVLARHEVLLISDEIICGFFRTGETFGAQTYGMRPDLMTAAKQLSAAYQPISAVLISEAIYQVVADASHEQGTFGHGFTYGGHPVACAAALAAIAEYERLDMRVRVAETGARLAAGLRGLADLPLVGDVRSIGLMGAVELDPAACRERCAREAPDVMRDVVATAEEAGAIFRAVGPSAVISPPMIVTVEQVDEMLAVLSAAIEAQDRRA